MSRWIISYPYRFQIQEDLFIKSNCNNFAVCTIFISTLSLVYPKKVCEVRLETEIFKIYCMHNMNLLAIGQKHRVYGFTCSSLHKKLVFFLAQSQLMYIRLWHDTDVLFNEVEETADYLQLTSINKYKWKSFLEIWNLWIILAYFTYVNECSVLYWIKNVY